MALTIPYVLDRVSDRRLITSGAIIIVISMFLGVFLESYTFMLCLWMMLGVGYSMIQTPTGRLLRRSAHPEDRPAVFAAQFALSHGTWLITYIIVGWLSANVSIPIAFGAMTVIAVAGLLIAVSLWPKNDPEMLEHEHPELSSAHPHLKETGCRHSHHYVIDAEHNVWPKTM